MQSAPDRRLTAFSAAMREHERVGGLEEDMEAETRLWHLIVSAIEFCDARQPPIDFDHVVEEVRQYLVEQGSY